MKRTAFSSDNMGDAGVSVLADNPSKSYVLILQTKQIFDAQRLRVSSEYCAG